MPAVQQMDGCVSVYVAAWHLKSKMVKYGNTWTAVGAYHSESPHENMVYQRQVEAIVRRMQNAGATAVADAR